MGSLRKRRPDVRPRAVPDPMRPDAIKTRSSLIEMPPHADHQRLINAANSYLRVYRLGECSVMVTREFGTWHLSIAHPRRYPTWDELAEARYRLLPDGATMAMVLPPREQYVNIHPNCFQIIEIAPQT